MTQLLLCIDDSGLNPKLGVKKGNVYTLRERHTPCCSENKGEFSLEETSLGRPVGMVCLFCGYRVVTRYPRYRKNRFIPINDPDAKVEEEKSNIRIIEPA